MATAAAAQQQSMPSLAELARQVEAAKPTVKKAKKSYTNASLGAEPRAAAPAAEPPAGYVSATTGKAVTADEMVKLSEEKVDSTNGHAMPEEHWRQRADSIRSQVAKGKEGIAQLQKAGSQPSAKIQALNDHEIEKLQQMIDGAMKRWALLEESARVARIPMAWIEPTPEP
jgi:hypothetical protein